MNVCVIHNINRHGYYYMHVRGGNKVRRRDSLKDNVIGTVIINGVCSESSVVCRRGSFVWVLCVL